MIWKTFGSTLNTQSDCDGLLAWLAGSDLGLDVIADTCC
jgi:hypothetical protein